MARGRAWERSLLRLPLRDLSNSTAQAIRPTTSPASSTTPPRAGKCTTSTSKTLSEKATPSSWSSSRRSKSRTPRGRRRPNRFWAGGKRTPFGVTSLPVNGAGVQSSPGPPSCPYSPECSERRQGEVRRMSLLRGRVNRDKSLTYLPYDELADDADRAQHADHRQGDGSHEGARNPQQAAPG